MHEIITIKKYVEFIHNEGSRYEFEDYDDDGVHIYFNERKKDENNTLHKVLVEDKKDWFELCEKYPIVYKF